MATSGVKCDYCGDEAVFGPLSGEGPVACAICAGLMATSVEPNSERHHALRPNVCPFCKKRTVAMGACGRPRCIGKDAASA